MIYDLETIYDYLNDREARPYERLREVRTNPLPDVEVTREVFDHFLDILPPGYVRGLGIDFYVPEAVTTNALGAVYSAYIAQGRQFFHRYIFLAGRP